MSAYIQLATDVILNQLDSGMVKVEYFHKHVTAWAPFCMLVL